MTLFVTFKLTDSADSDFSMLKNVAVLRLVPGACRLRIALIRLISQFVGPFRSQQPWSWRRSSLTPTHPTHQTLIWKAKFKNEGLKKHNTSAQAFGFSVQVHQSWCACYTTKPFGRPPRRAPLPQSVQTCPRFLVVFFPSACQHRKCCREENGAAITMATGNAQLFAFSLRCFLFLSLWFMPLLCATRAFPNHGTLKQELKYISLVQNLPKNANKIGILTCFV